MVNKFVGAIVRVKDPQVNNEKTIPFGFKIKKDLLPDSIRSQNDGSISSVNMVNVLIPGREPLPCYIFTIGETTTEIIKTFEANFKNAPLSEMKGLQEKIVHWIDLDNITIGFPSVPQDQFDRTIKQFKKAEKRTNENCAIKVNEKCSSSPAKVKKTIKTRLRSRKSCDVKPIPLIELDNETNCNEISESQQSQFSFEDGKKFKVPKIDGTYVKKGINFIGGILPLKYSDYNRAMSRVKTESDEISILRSIIEHAFPRHWRLPLTGQSPDDKLSLVSLWNHPHPLVHQFQGPCTEGLGEARLKVLIEHVLRKANKTEYNEEDKENLEREISLALKDQ